MTKATGNVVDRYLRSQGSPQTTVNALFDRDGIKPSAYFLDAQLGSDTNDGRDPNAPKKTIASALSVVQSGDTIYMVGNFTEEVTASNLLEDVTFVGVANRPRHADHARDIATYTTYKGVSGCSWRQAASHGATTPLIKVRGQGFRFENILFVPPSDAAAVELERNALENVSEYDASHAAFVGCRFAGGQSGIEDDGGCFNVLVDDCTFMGSTYGIRTLGTAVAQPLMWTVKNSLFSNNTNHMAVDATQWAIIDNVFGKFATASIKLNQIGNTGGANVIARNALSGTYSIVGGYIRNASTDEWGGNFNSLTGGVTADDPA